MTQVVARIDDDLVATIDALVADGVVASRSDAVRTALEAFVDGHRRRRIGDVIVRGYEETPQRTDESLWPDAATVAMIAEEPW